ncbi:MAG: hypothetical protein KIS85_03260 [Anaerolineales bacterium]|nr:hypothetical protein [Anaerolineales bacterium]
MLKSFLRFFALFALIVCTLALPASLAFRNIGNLFFEPESTKQLVRDTLMNSDLAGRLARRGAEQMLRGRSGEELAVRVFEELDEQEWKQITEVIAPEGLVSDALDGAVDAFAEWLDDPDATFPELSVSLTAWKTSAVQRAGDVTALVFNSLPDCTFADVNRMLQLSVQDPLALTQNLPVCRPPEPLYATFVGQSGRLLGQMVELAPNTIDLGQVIEDSQAPEALLELKQNLLMLRAWLNWGWAAVVALMLLAALLAASDLKGFLAWFGWPLWLSGVIMISLGFLLLIFSFQFVGDLLERAAADALFLQTLTGAVADGALRRISGPLLLQGVLVTLASSGVVLWARSLHQREASPGIPLGRRRIGL